MRRISIGILAAWFLWYADGAVYTARQPAISPIGPTGEQLTDQDQKSVCLAAAATLRAQNILAFCAPSADPATVLGSRRTP